MSGLIFVSLIWYKTQRLTTCKSQEYHSKSVLLLCDNPRYKLCLKLMFSDSFFPLL